MTKNQYLIKQSDHQKHKSALITTTCISSTKAFKDLKEDWNDLLKISSKPHPFISWEWQFTWWEIFANKDDKVMIIVVQNNKQIIGIAPFYIKQNFIGKALMLLGEGERDKEAVTTHYQDIICEDANSDIVIQCISVFLKKNRSWDYTRFSFLLDQSYLYLVFFSLDKSYFFQLSLGYQYKINLELTHGELLNQLSKSTRRSFRSKYNRLTKVAPLALISLDFTDSLDSSFAKLEELHGHRQKEKGSNNPFLESRFKQFHYTLAKRLKGTDKVELRALKHGDEVIASVLNYLSQNGVYSYIGGFRSKDDKRYSPMFVFDLMDLERSIGCGYKYYDLLSASSESSYKDIYNAEKTPVSRAYWFSPTPIGLARYGLINIKSVLKRVKTMLK